MKQEFKRKAILPILSLITAGLTGFTAVLQLSMGNPIAFLNLITCGLCLINAIWLFATPYAIIDDDIIHIKYSIAKEKVIYTSDIEKIDLLNKRYVKIYYRNTSIKIWYGSISGFACEDFKEAINQINQNHLTI